jgi:N-acylneuraminate cytidylyltransferase
MSIISIIPARGGSKRIPRKNIRDFCGKPIISYSIKAAVESEIFDEVMVSTDDPEIADAAKSCGANVPFLRSSNTADDFATTADVIKEVLQNYESELGQRFDVVCCLYPASPLITGNDLRKALEIFVESRADSLMPVVKYSYPPQRGIVINNGCITRINPQYENTRSQDLEPIYHDAGQFYFVKAESFKSYNALICGKSVPIELSELAIQDIDTLEDWKLAEMKYEILNQNA